MKPQRPGFRELYCSRRAIEPLIQDNSGRATQGAQLKKRKKIENKGKNNEVKNGVFIDSNVTYIPGLKPGVKRKQAKLYKGVQTLEDEEGERASAGVFGSPEQSAEKDPSGSSSLGISKLRSKPG